MWIKDFGVIFFWVIFINIGNILRSDIFLGYNLKVQLYFQRRFKGNRLFMVFYVINVYNDCLRVKSFRCFSFLFISEWFQVIDGLRQEEGFYVIYGEGELKIENKKQRKEKVSFKCILFYIG